MLLTSRKALKSARLRWRGWRRGRPFWGGLLTLAAGAEICYLPLAPLQVMIRQGVAGIPSVLMGICMIVMGLAMWFSPQSRTLAGVVTVLVALAALVLSNLGGFLLGTLLGIAGGSLGFAWRPIPVPAPTGEQVAGGPAPDDSAADRPATEERGTRQPASGDPATGSSASGSSATGSSATGSSSPGKASDGSPPPREPSAEEAAVPKDTAAAA